MDNNLKLVLDKVLLQKYQGVVLDDKFKSVNESDVNTKLNLNVDTISELGDLVLELKKYGYGLDDSLIKKYLHLDTTLKAEFLNSLLTNINQSLFELSGEVFFKDFPNFKYDVSVRLLHQLVNYYTVYGNEGEGGFSEFGERVYTPILEDDYIPSDEDLLEDKLYFELNGKDYKQFLVDNNLKVISEKEDYVLAKSYFKNLINSKSSITEDDVNNIKQYLALIDTLSKDDKIGLLPDKIERKEIMAVVIATLLVNGYKLDDYKKYILTATDVLRVLDVLGGGDGTLNKFTLPKLSRKDRKNILSLLDVINPYVCSEDMFRQYKVWKGLSKVLHPFESRHNQFKNTKQAFKLLLDGDKSHTFNSKLKVYESTKNYKELVKLLKTRPGEFSRKLDLILRNADDTDKVVIVKEFQEVIGDVASLVLYQLLSYLKNVDNNISKVETKKGFYYRETNSMDDLSRYMLEGVIKNELNKRYSEKEDLGRVYLDSKLKQYNIPISQRTSSLSKDLITRGSKITLNLKDNLRLFTYWKDVGESACNDEYYGRVDLDLSAALFDKDLKSKGTVGFYNAYNQDLAIYSGDMTSAPNGANEFIDFNIQHLKDKGVKYIVQYINVFTSSTFKDFDCKVGWLNLDNDELGLQFNRSGKVMFDNKEVKGLIDVNSNHNSCIPMVIDIEKGIGYWLDETLSQGFGLHYVSMDSVNNTIQNVINRLEGYDYVSIYDLLDMHIKARGSVEVFNKEDADIVFENDDNNPLDLSLILSDYF